MSPTPTCHPRHTAGYPCPLGADIKDNVCATPAATARPAPTLRPSPSSALIISAARIALNCSASAFLYPRSWKTFPSRAPLPAFYPSSAPPTYFIPSLDITGHRPTTSHEDGRSALGCGSGAAALNSTEKAVAGATALQGAFGRATFMVTRELTLVCQAGTESEIPRCARNDTGGVVGFDRSRPPKFLWPESKWRAAPRP